MSYLRTTRRRSPQFFWAGFTLVEMLVATAVFALIMLVLFQTVSSSSDLWTRTTARIAAFQGARAAFDAVSRNLGQATLKTYHAYIDASGNPVPLLNPAFKMPGGGNVPRNAVPVDYARTSELQFVSGPAGELFDRAGVAPLGSATGLTSGHGLFFQAPLGFTRNPLYKLNSALITACGYYIEFGNDARARPPFLQSDAGGPPDVYRYRLVEVVQPAENNEIYRSTNLLKTDGSGFPELSYDLGWVASLAPEDKHFLSTNIIFMAVLPKLSPTDEEALSGGKADGGYLSPEYWYDSRSWEVGYPGSSARVPLERSQLPPLVDLILVAIDEKSASRMAAKYGGADQRSAPLLDASLRSELGLVTGFQTSADLDGPNGDLAVLEAGLQHLGYNYRIFRTEVRIQGAKWSSD